MALNIDKKLVHTESSMHTYRFVIVAMVFSELGF